MWNVHSTEESRALAGEAITLALRHLVSCVECPTPEARLGMCAASHAAGKAINLTRTTAPHALSYTMTARFGVPHGHAVALTLGQVLAFNSGVTDDDVTDPRGAAFVRGTLEHLNRLLECGDAAEALGRIEALMKSVRLETRLCDVGNAHQRPALVAWSVLSSHKATMHLALSCKVRWQLRCDLHDRGIREELGALVPPRIGPFYCFGVLSRFLWCWWHRLVT